MQLRSIITAAVSAVAVVSADAAVIMTGIVDGTLSGGNPKAIELYIDGTEDLSSYTLERSSNGGTFGSSFALSGIYTDTFVYLIGTGNGGVAAFDNVFGTTGIFANRITSGNVNGNGNDGFRLLSGAVVVDTFGNPADVSASADYSAPWAYQDSFAYRVDDTGPDGGFVLANWSFEGNGALNGLSAAQHNAAVPFGTYAIPEPTSLSLLGLGAMGLIRRRK